MLITDIVNKRLKYETGKPVSSKGTPLEYNKDKIKLYEPHWFYGYKPYINK